MNIYFLVFSLIRNVYHIDFKTLFIITQSKVLLRHNSDELDQEPAAKINQIFENHFFMN